MDNNMMMLLPLLMSMGGKGENGGAMNDLLMGMMSGGKPTDGLSGMFQGKGADGLAGMFQGKGGMDPMMMMLMMMMGKGGGANPFASMPKNAEAKGFSPIEGFSGNQVMELLQAMMHTKQKPE